VTIYSKTRDHHPDQNRFVVNPWAASDSLADWTTELGAEHSPSAPTRHKTHARSRVPRSATVRRSGNEDGRASSTESWRVESKTFNDVTNDTSNWPDSIGTTVTEEASLGPILALSKCPLHSPVRSPSMLIACLAKLLSRLGHRSIPPTTFQRPSRCAGEISTAVSGPSSSAKSRWRSRSCQLAHTTAPAVPVRTSSVAVFFAAALAAASVAADAERSARLARMSALPVNFDRSLPLTTSAAMRGRAFGLLSSGSENRDTTKELPNKALRLAQSPLRLSSQFPALKGSFVQAPEAVPKASRSSRRPRSANIGASSSSQRVRARPLRRRSTEVAEALPAIGASEHTVKSMVRPLSASSSVSSSRELRPVRKDITTQTEDAEEAVPRDMFERVLSLVQSQDQSIDMFQRQLQVAEASKVELEKRVEFLRRRNRALELQQEEMEDERVTLKALVVELRDQLREMRAAATHAPMTPVTNRVLEEAQSRAGSLLFGDSPAAALGGVLGISPAREEE
jgi:hypothetical protein